MATVPVTIFQFAMSPFENWQHLAWAGALLLTLFVLLLNLSSRFFFRNRIPSDYHADADTGTAGARRRLPLQGPPGAQVDHLDIAAKQITAIIGPSGCGKSTLLRIFNRIYSEYPGLEATGEILMDGENILDPKYSLSRLRSTIGMVFQKPVPFPMSIADNVAYGSATTSGCPGWSCRIASSRPCAARRCGTRSRTSSTRAPWVSPAVSSSAVHRPHHRPASAGAAAGRADLGLDPISTARIEQLLAELKQEFTVVIVTHNMQQAARLLRRHRLHVPGRADRSGQDRQDLHQAGQEADRGLHHRSLRLRISPALGKATPRSGLFHGRAERGRAGRSPGFSAEKIVFTSEKDFFPSWQRMALP